MKRCPVCVLPVVKVASIEKGWFSYRCMNECTPQTLMSRCEPPYESKIVKDSITPPDMCWISSVEGLPPQSGYIFACFVLDDEHLIFRECQKVFGEWWERNAIEPLPYTEPTYWMAF